MAGAKERDTVVRCGECWATEKRIVRTEKGIHRIVLISTKYISEIVLTKIMAEIVSKGLLTEL